MKHYIIRICQFLCVLAVVMGIGLGVASLPRTTSAIGVTANNTGTPSANTASAAQKSTVDMGAVSTKIQAVVDQSSLDIGVSVIDLDTNAQVDAGESAPFLAASTTKVLTAAYYMHQVEQGKASLDTIIDGASAQTLMQRMLNQSDNAAWASLNDYLGKANLQSYASQLGLSSYDSVANTITAHDQARLLAKLQANRLASEAHTSSILAAMHNTNNETLIPAALPADATVYHKYGQLYGELHDSAIITDKDAAFVLVIFTKSNTDSITDLTTRTQLFHDITTAVVQSMAP